MAVKRTSHGTDKKITSAYVHLYCCDLRTAWVSRIYLGQQPNTIRRSRKAFRPTGEGQFVSFFKSSRWARAKQTWLPVPACPVHFALEDLRQSQVRQPNVPCSLEISAKLKIFFVPSFIKRTEQLCRQHLGVWSGLTPIICFPTIPRH